MNALTLISQLFPAFELNNAKVHLASFNDKDAPIDVYLAGNFPDWQSYQNARNFERKYVVALIELAEPHLWLFAGLFESLGIEKLNERRYQYELTDISDCSELNGQLVIEFRRPGRNSYLKAERWSDQILVSEIRRNGLTIRNFPGYRNIDISFQELQHLVRQSPPSWVAALSSIAGVYLISDLKLGKLYVGSASGQGGIWSRWTSYAKTEHGGNKELRELLKSAPAQSQHWRLSVLELADVTASDESVLIREAHWKKILASRSHGLNAN